MICNDHNPVKHRDGKPPWCKRCGLTKYGVPPWDLEGLSKIFKGETMLNIKHYRVKPDDQRAVEVTKTNMSEVAKWCGGQVMEGMGIEPGDKGDYLYIPTMSGPISARPGEIVAKDSNGRFNVFDKDRFMAKYEEYGTRGFDAPYLVN